MCVHAQIKPFSCIFCDAEFGQFCQMMIHHRLCKEIYIKIRKEIKDHQDSAVRFDLDTITENNILGL